MEYLWWFMIFTALVLYPAVLIRGAMRGRRWALDTLEAMRYLGGDMMTFSAWRALPPERPTPATAEAELDSEPAHEEPGRLVA